MNRVNSLDWTAAVLIIVGALNWGLVGLFQFDLVAALFGGQESLLARIVYTLVGISGLYMIYSLGKLGAVERHRALS
jgi:uncharacterized membrane protein YuzA (DUF378 family)